MIYDSTRTRRHGEFKGRKNLTPTTALSFPINVFPTTEPYGNACPCRMGFADNVLYLWVASGLLPVTRRFHHGGLGRNERRKKKIYIKSGRPDGTPETCGFQREIGHRDNFRLRIISESKTEVVGDTTNARARENRGLRH